MAEKEGFEPSIPFWGIHDFQSCALGQLRDFSIHRCSWSAKIYYNTSFRLSTPIFTFFTDEIFLTGIHPADKISVNNLSEVIP